MEWTTTELATIGATEDLLISTVRADGTLRRWTPIWVVESEGELYVRSAYGPSAAWYRHARAGGAQVRAGTADFPVALELVDDANTRVDDGYRRKYASQPSSVQQMISDIAVPTTSRLVKRA